MTNLTTMIKQATFLKGVIAKIKHKETHEHIEKQHIKTIQGGVSIYLFYYSV